MAQHALDTDTGLASSSRAWGLRRSISVSASSAYAVSEASGWPGGLSLSSWLSTSLVLLACAGMAAAAIGLLFRLVWQ